MNRRRLAVLTAVPLLVVSLASCGGDETTTTTSPSPSPTTATSEPTPLETESAAPTPTTSPSAAESSAPADAGGDPGAAPEGAVIAAGAEDAAPAAIGAWAREGTDPTYLSYTMGEFTNSYSVVADADYAALAEEVVQMSTPAGTGVCGKTEGGNSNLCYLGAADGVVLVLGDDDLPVPDLVTFANQLTAALGAG